MSVFIDISSTTDFASWIMHRSSCSWPSTLKATCSQILELPTAQRPQAEFRPLKRVRTDLMSNLPRFSTNDLQEADLFNLPTGFQLPQIRISTQPPAENRLNAKDGNGGESGCLKDNAMNTFLAETTPLSWLDRCMFRKHGEEPELSSTPLPVSPLETPSDFLGCFSQATDDVDLDPLGDIDMLVDDDMGIDTTDQQIVETPYHPMVRYLADIEDPTPSQQPSITRPDFIRSTAPVDIKSELQRFESDISDFFEGMNLSTNGSSEFPLQSLEASLDLEDSKNGAEGETRQPSEENDDIFTLDGDESVVIGPKDISPELESWISKSSLIVGRSLKPLTGGIEGSHIPHGRKRKASTSTCQ
ncbi:hypothetical protein ABW20_dc0100727 [Dactylellina cionopaga]|nr:hypothetical protein ABW20_dc0100727 [Dactylellina cionopaga]